MKERVKKNINKITKRLTKQPCQPVRTRQAQECLSSSPSSLPGLYLVQVESWDGKIFKVVLMTADSCWSCGGQDDVLSCPLLYRLLNIYFH